MSPVEKSRSAEGQAPARRPWLGAPELLRVLLVAADCMLVGVALAFAYLVRFQLDVGVQYGLVGDTIELPPVGPYLRLFAMLGPMVLALMALHDLYRTDGLHSTIEEVGGVFRAVSIAMGLVLAVTFFYRDFAYSRFVLLFSWAVSAALISAAHLAFRALLVARFRRGKDLRRTLLLGEPTSHVTLRLVEEPVFGILAVGYLSVPADEKAVRARHSSGERPTSESGRVGALVASAASDPEIRAPREIPRLGDYDALVRLLDDLAIDEVVVVDPMLSHRRLLESIDACEQRRVAVRLVPPIYDLLIDPTDFVYVDNVPILRVDERRYRREQALIKRVFDVAVAGTLLLSLSWLFLLVALFIRRGSPGPALFTQLRAGEGGRPFRMLKFRTMVKDAEARLTEVVDLDALKEPVFKLKNDPRITRIGRLLRKTSIDELPQLWNVLKGDMSLVGPRPEELKVVERYDVWQRRRLKVKPGITGLQQVTCRGTLSLNERVRWDVYYVRKQSFMLDVWILFRTVWVVLTARGAT